MMATSISSENALTAVGSCVSAQALAYVFISGMWVSVHCAGEHKAPFSRKFLSSNSAGLHNVHQNTERIPQSAGGLRKCKLYPHGHLYQAPYELTAVGTSVENWKAR